MSQRWVVLISAIFFQTILGGVYAWSAFTPALIETYGLTRAQCGFIFGMLFALFTISMNISGRMMIRYGPRLVACIAACFFAAGYGLAAFSSGNFWILVLCISGLVGVANGFGYVGPLTVGMKWFPERKGLITGVVVAGFGSGAVLLSAVAQQCLSAGMDVLVLFGWMGAILGILLMIAAQGMADPPVYKAKTTKIAVRPALKTVAFWVITFGMFCGTCSGLLLIGNLFLIVMEAGLSEMQAVASVSIFAVGNATGRIVWGHWFDRFGYVTIPASLGCFALFILLIMLPLPSTVLLLATGVLGFGFGSCFVVYASSMSRYFGVDAFPVLYGLCFLGYGVAGIIGPTIGGWLADVYGSFDASVLLSMCIVGVASLLTAVGVRFFDATNDEVPLVHEG